MKTDSQLQINIIEELKWEPSVNHEHIGVAVSDGIVTLSGTVPSFIEKHNAEKAAQRVAGVKAIVEKIEVKLPGSMVRDDEDIAKAIVNQFQWSTLVPHDKIQAKVSDGWVTLSGEVAWEYQRKAAIKLVRELVGVKFVTNSIVLKPKLEASELKEKIERALLRAAEHESKQIAIDVHGSQVTLSGYVHSFADLKAVEGAAWGAPGVTEVTDNLKVIASNY
ncbi:MAG: BON domain-containing protein [Bacteriovorax sp.]|nr:BON domain-containing protein [Bacteriovorax sp.]